MKIVNKPWGHEQVLTFNEKSTVKILTVKPHKKISLQYHFKREEIWYFLTDGYVQLGNKIRKVGKGEILNTKKKMKHRLFSEDKEVKVLEISLGRFEWNDVVRIEDDFGREGTTKI